MSVYFAIPIMLLLAVLQTAVLPLFPIYGMTPQLLLLVALAWGLLRGPEEGVVWAFIGGLSQDLFSVGVLGSSALAMMAAVLVGSLIQKGLPTNRSVLPLLLSALATFIFFFVHIMLNRLGGYIVSWEVLSITPAYALMHTIAILPIYGLLYLLHNVLSPRRVLGE